MNLITMFLWFQTLVTALDITMQQLYVLAFPRKMNCALNPHLFPLDGGNKKNVFLHWTFACVLLNRHHHLLALTVQFLPQCPLAETQCP